MALSTAQLASLILGGIFLFVMAYFFIQAYRSKSHISKLVTTRGANGVSGGQLSLSCPSGKKIKIATGTYTCYPTCDPGTGNGTLSLTGTKDAVVDMSPMCDGKETCNFTIPDGSSMSDKCSGCKSLQLIGTYDCV